MSESDGGPGRREVAYRLFAAEYDDADRSHSESDEERAPNYVVTPTGARVNRLFVVGVLTEVESVSEDYLRARVVDPTGPFVVYAGQYQPEAMRFLEAAEPPAFVAVTGKARTFQPEDSDRVYTSIRPESINEVDAETRDRWVIQAAHATIERVTRVAEAKATGLAGEDLTATLRAGDVDAGLVTGIPIALSHYGTTGKYLATLRTVATQALEVVAGDRDEIDATLPTPDAGEDEPVAALAERTLEAVSAGPDGESEASGERSVDVSAAEDASGSAVEHSDAAGEAGST
jgi:RPA family protein